jgi:hypothetical protein
MSCLISPAFWVYIIFLIAAIAIIRIIVPWIVTFFGFPDPIPRIIMIVLWAVIAAAGVYFFFNLMQCLFSGGLSFPAFPHGR